MDFVTEMQTVVSIAIIHFIQIKLQRTLKPLKKINIVLTFNIKRIRVKS